MRLVKFLASLVARAFSTDEEVHQAVERNFAAMETFLRTGKVGSSESAHVEDDALAAETSFIETDDENIDLTLVFLLDKLLAHSAAMERCLPADTLDAIRVIE